MGIYDNPSIIFIKKYFFQILALFSARSGSALPRLWLTPDRAARNGAARGLTAQFMFSRCQHNRKLVVASEQIARYYLSRINQGRASIHKKIEREARKKERSDSMSKVSWIILGTNLGGREKTTAFGRVRGELLLFIEIVQQLWAIEVVSFYDPILSKMDQKVKGSHSSAAVHLNQQLRVLQPLYKLPINYNIKLYLLFFMIF